MRIAVIGRNGQIARALSERAAICGAKIVTLARPQLDLLEPDHVMSSVHAAQVDIVVIAAAFTAVDQAETDMETARIVNVAGASAVAAAANALKLPAIFLSTDYVFDGSLDRPYREDDTPNPINTYGCSKFDGERAVAAANPNHVVLRTAWIYSPFGKNFLRTMLALARSKSEISVVSDQIGTPTSALDIADGILKICSNMLAFPNDATMRGIFHLVAKGECSWADFAETIFSAAASMGGPSARVIPISTASYPTPARRPKNSRLDTTKILQIHGVELPDWRMAVNAVVTRLLTANSET